MMQPGTRARWTGIVVAAVAMAAAPAVGLTTKHSHHCPPGSRDPHYCMRIPTRLSAAPVVPEVLSATLRRGDDHSPIAGQTLTFTAGGTTLCTAVTRNSGTASCTSLDAVLAAALNVGYDVRFAGTAMYIPSSAHGTGFRLAVKLIELDGQKVPRDKRSDAAWLEQKLGQIGTPTLRDELRRLRRHAH